MKYSLTLLVTLLSAALSVSPAADWPQFRGAGGTGVVTETVTPPDTWAVTQNVAWKCEVPGHGWSCPIVVGGKVFVTSCVTDAKVAAPKTGYYAPKDTKTHDGEHRWTLFCFDAASGKVLWEKVAHKGKPQHPIHVKASYASETPVSDGERVYAYFGNVGLFCYDLTGNLLWSKSWDVMPTQLDWGTGASPVLHEGRIYLVNDNEKASFLVALDKLTGEQVWKTDRAEEQLGDAVRLEQRQADRDRHLRQGEGAVLRPERDGAVGVRRHVVHLRAVAGGGGWATPRQFGVRVRASATGVRGEARSGWRHLAEEGRDE